MAPRGAKTKGGTGMSMKFEFVEDKEKYNAKIKVVGIGGAG